MNRRHCLATLAAAPLFATGTGNTVPRKSPPFTYELANGTESLSKYAGKVICVQFLFTTCPHCQVASQLLSKLNTEFGPRGFQPIGVSFNPMSKMLNADYVRDFHVSFPVGAASREAVMTYLGYSPEERISVPQIVFIDRKGTIRQQSKQTNDANAATEANLRSMIELLLKEGGAAKAASKKR